MMRTNIFVLKPTHQQDKILRHIGDTSAVLWNKINYYRRQMMFNDQEIDWKVNNYFEFSGEIGSAVSQQIIRKNQESWKSFFALCKLKHNHKLPDDTKIKPPSYLKDRKTNKRKMIIVERNNMYHIKGHSLYIPTSKKLKSEYGLKDKFRIKYQGDLKWSGKQCRLEIIYNELKNKWYVYQSVEVEDKKPLHQLRKNKAYIDLGVKNLITSITPKCNVIYSGRSILADWWYWNKRIADHKSELKKVNNKDTSTQLKRLYRIRKLRFRHAINAMIRKYVKQCDKEQVGTIVVGDVSGITRHRRNRKTNSMVNNFWSYNYITNRLKDKAEEFGIKVEFVDESYTSRTCPECGYRTKSNRKYRGLFVCKKCNYTQNADIVGAMNIRKNEINDTCNPLEILESNNRVMAHPLILKWQQTTWESGISCL